MLVTPTVLPKVDEKLNSRLSPLIPPWVTEWHVFTDSNTLRLNIRHETGKLCSENVRRLREAVESEVTSLNLNVKIKVLDFVRRHKGSPLSNHSFPAREVKVPEVPKVDRTHMLSDLRRTLPVNCELLRHVNYRVPLSQGDFDFLVLKMHVPKHKEESLAKWREAFEEKYQISVFINRVATVSGISRQLANLLGDDTLLTKKHCPAIQTCIEDLCGKLPKVEVDLKSALASRDFRDMTNLKFVAIDHETTQDREDALYAEKLPSGKIRLLVGVVDVTPFVEQGSKMDRYVQRVGATFYGEFHRVPTLGPLIAHNYGSFLKGETRPAWVIELILSEEGEILNKNYPKVHRALIKAHEHYSPAQFTNALADPSNDSGLRILAYSGLALNQNRRGQRGLIRVEGNSLAETVVGECMIAAKSTLPRYLEKNGMPIIRRVHARPSFELKELFALELNMMGIPAKPHEFDEPLQFAGILRCLEDKKSPEAIGLTSKLLDLFLLRSSFSTHKIGHFGLGAEDYMELKPRDSSGLTNQFQLDALFTGRRCLSPEQVETRAITRTNRKWGRDDTIFRFRSFESLLRHLSCEGATYIGRVSRVKPTQIFVAIPGFAHWGIIPSEGAASKLMLGMDVPVRLQGFSVEKKRYKFSLG